MKKPIELEGPMSNCCSSGIIHTDICEDCKEHCTPIMIDMDGNEFDAEMHPGEIYIKIDR